MQDPENGLESPPAYECPPRAPAKPWEVPTPMVTRGGKQTLAKEAAAAEQAKIKLEQATEEEKKEARVAEEAGGAAAGEPVPGVVLQGGGARAAVRPGFPPAEDPVRPFLRCGAHLGTQGAHVYSEFVCSTPIVVIAIVRRAQRSLNNYCLYLHYECRWTAPTAAPWLSPCRAECRASMRGHGRRVTGTWRSTTIP